MQTPQTMAPNTIYGTKQPHFDSSYSNSIAQKQTKIDFNLPAPYAYQQEPLNSIQLPNGIRLVPMPMPPPQYQQSVVDVGPLIGASGKTDFIKTWQQGVEDAAIGVQSFPSEEPPGYNKQDISDHFTSVSKSTRRSSRDDSSKADRKHRHRRHSRRRSPSTQYDSDSRTTATKTSKTSKSSRSRRSRSRRHSSSEQSESSESSTETDSYTTGKGRSKSVTNVSERTYRTGQSSKSSSKKHRRRRSDSGTEETESEGISTTVVSTAKSHSSRTSASSKQPKSKSSSNRRHRSHSVDDRDEIRERRSEKSERRRERNSPKEVKKKSGRYKDGGSSITSRSYQSRSVDELSHLPSSEPISPGVPLNIPMSAVQTGLYQSGRNPPATPPKPLTSQSQLPYVTPPRVAQPPQFNRSTSAGVKMTLNNSGSSTQPPTTPPGQSGSGQTAVYTSSGSSGAGGIPRPQRLNSSQNDPTADNKVYISTAV